MKSKACHTRMCQHSKLINRLEQLRVNAVLSDVNVTWGHDVIVKTHKCILAASSLYFKGIFTTVEGAKVESVDLSRETIHAEYVDNIIEYMYSGCIALDLENVVGITMLASFLECQDVLDLCLEFLDQILDNINCLSLYMKFHNLRQEDSTRKESDGLEKIRVKMWQSVEKNFWSKLVLGEEVLKMPHDDMLYVLSRVRARCEHTENLVLLATRWLSTHKDNAALQVVDAISCLVSKVSQNGQLVTNSCIKYVSMLLEVVRRRNFDSSSTTNIIVNLEKLLHKKHITGNIYITEQETSRFGEERAVYVPNAHSAEFVDIEKESCRTENHYESDTDEFEGAENDELKQIRDTGEEDKSKGHVKQIKVGHCDRHSESVGKMVKMRKRQAEIRTTDEIEKAEQSNITYCGEENIKEVENIYNELDENETQHLNPETESEDREGGDDLCEDILEMQKKNSGKVVQKAYDCSLCGKKFSKISGLERHLVTHGDKTDKCVICGQMFGHRSHLVNHMMKVHKDVKTYTCEICGEAVSNMKNIVRHMKTHPSLRKELGHDILKFRVKYDVSEDGKKFFRCDECDKTFTRNSGLQKHMLIHTGKRPFTCNECNFGFKTKYQLKWHKQKIHLGVAGRELRCVKCGFRFYDEKNYEKHTGQCEGKKLSCAVCGKKFQYQVELDRHTISHSDIRMHSCDKCPRRFKHVQNLKAHVLLKHQNIDKVTCASVCDHCGKVLKNRNCLRRHLLTHEEQRPYKCLQCPKSYTQSTGLEVHMRIHTGEKPYQCEICSEMFVIKCNLDRHIQRHLGEKPHKCDKCDKAFVQITDLKRHQTVHTGVKKFPCRFCGKLFALKKSVPVHERIHTGERPFKCSTCRKCFSTKSDLRRHEKTHLKDKPASRICQGASENMEDSARSGLSMLNFMESYPPMDRMGFQSVPLNRNEIQTQNVGQYVQTFPGAIGFY